MEENVIDSVSSLLNYFPMLRVLVWNVIIDMSTMALLEMHGFQGEENQVVAAQWEIRCIHQDTQPPHLQRSVGVMIHDIAWNQTNE